MTTDTTNMAFIVNRKAFTDALTTLSPSVCKRSTLPILDNVLIAVTDEITVSATNLEIATKLQVPSDSYTIVETGSLTVNHKELLALLKPMKDEEVYFTQRDNTLQIEGEHVNVTLNGMDSSEYPLIPYLTYEEGKQQRITLPIETLRKMTTLTAFAAADDDSRPVLTGVNARLKDDTFTLAGCDAFRLARINETIPDSGSWDFDVLIPATTLIAVNKQLPKPKKGMESGNITITTSVNKTQAMFTYEGYTLVTRLIDGTYPNYMQIIPCQGDVIAEVEVSALKSALDMVKPIAYDSSNITRFHINGHIDVEANAEDKHLEVAVPAQTTNNEGEWIDIILNHKYVSDFLTVHPKGSMQIELQGPLKPAKISYPDTPGFVGVIMPMHINR